MTLRQKLILMLGLRAAVVAGILSAGTAEGIIQGVLNA